MNREPTGRPTANPPGDSQGFIQKKNNPARLLPFMGPAFIAAVAYIAPGNFATNIQGGASFGFQLLLHRRDGLGQAFMGRHSQWIVIPLIWFTARRSIMQELTNNLVTTFAACAAAAIILGLNAYLVLQFRA